MPVLSCAVDRCLNGTPACAGPAKQWLSTGACEMGPTSTQKVSARPTGRPTRFQHRAQAPRPSEPILIPKLRIQFADFPYLHYSIDQRLLTSETCCGYGYGPARNSHRHRGVFKGRRERTGHHKSRGALRSRCPYLRLSHFQGGSSLQRKENSSRGPRRRPPLRLRYRTWPLRTILRVRVREY